MEFRDGSLLFTQGIKYLKRTDETYRSVFKEGFVVTPKGDYSFHFLEMWDTNRHFEIQYYCGGDMEVIANTSKSLLSGRTVTFIHPPEEVILIKRLLFRDCFEPTKQCLGRVLGFLVSDTSNYLRTYGYKSNDEFARHMSEHRRGEDVDNWWVWDTNCEFKDDMCTHLYCHGEVFYSNDNYVEHLRKRQPISCVKSARKVAGDH